MKIKILEGNHLTTTDRKLIKYAINENVLDGREVSSGRKKLLLERLDKEKSSFIARITHNETNDYGMRIKKSYKYVIEVA